MICESYFGGGCKACRKKREQVKEEYGEEVGEMDGLSQDEADDHDSKGLPKERLIFWDWIGFVITLESAPSPKDKSAAK